MSIQKAKALATKAHKGQVDKRGEDYINHPIRVAERCSEKAKIVALLHDTVEDTYITLETINKEFGIDISNAIRMLTHIKGVPYMEYIERLSENKLAKEVKIADLLDNLDPDRDFKGRDNTKYNKAIAYLLNK